MLNWIERQRIAMTNGQTREAIGQFPQLPSPPDGDVTTNNSLSEAQRLASPHHNTDPHPLLDRVWFTEHGFTIFRLEPLPRPIVRLNVTREDLRSLKKVKYDIAQKCFMYPVDPVEAAPFPPPSE